MVANFNSGDHALGYVPVHDLPRVHSAINDGSLTSVTMNRVVGKVQPTAGKVIFVAYLNLLKTVRVVCLSPITPLYSSWSESVLDMSE